jgi:hypothetical protein
VFQEEKKNLIDFHAMIEDGGGKDLENDGNSEALRVHKTQKFDPSSLLPEKFKAKCLEVTSQYKIFHHILCLFYLVFEPLQFPYSMHVCHITMQRPLRSTRSFYGIFTPYLVEEGAKRQPQV